MDYDKLSVLSEAIHHYNETRVLEAIAGFELVLEVEPDNENVLYWLGMCYLQRNRRVSAGEQMLKLCRLNRKHFACWHLGGLISAAEADFHQQQADLQESSEYSLRVVRALRREAVSNLSKAINFCPMESVRAEIEIARDSQVALLTELQKRLVKSVSTAGR